MSRQLSGTYDPATAHLWKDLRHIPRHLRFGQTRWVYEGPNGLHWDLAGRHEGRQGAKMTNVLGGAYHLPFEHLLTESAYQIGATYERSNILKRIISMGVVLGGPQYSSWAYSMIEANWWDSWPHDTPGWLGCITPFGGIRWAQVQLAKVVDSPMKKDPRYAGNNLMIWDMDIMAVKPWYGKRMLVEQWTANPDTVTAQGYDETVFTIANRSQMPAWPMFLYSAPGRAWVQDGMTSRMQELPLISAKDGYVLVQTDPAERTLSASKDPVDELFYDLIADFARQSRILDLFLHDLTSLELPVWRRMPGIRFTSQIPPRTVANIRVRHSVGGGTIVCLMPQRYKRPS
jgi:hypothetical protein